MVGHGLGTVRRVLDADRPLTVGYFVRRYPELSQTFVRLEVAALRRLGARVLVGSLHRAALSSNDPDHSVVRDLGTDRAAVARAGARSALQPVRAAKAAAAMRKLGDEFGRGADAVRPDGLLVLADRWQRLGVEHVHAHFAWEGAAAAMVMARLLGCTWSVTVHANDMYSQRLHLDVKLADADRVITVCEYNRRRLIELEGVTGDVPIVICGVEEAPAATGPKLVDVVAVGRLVEKKGFDLLVTAAALLEKRHPDLRVSIIGDGPERESLQQLIDGLGVGGIVTLHGALEHDLVLEHISAARVAALPCRIGSDDDRDSMPVVVKEAMMRAVPVVGTDVAAMSEMVDSECGRLVRPNDPAALADAIGEILDDADLRAALGASARDRALDRFVIDDHVEVLYREFMAMARPHP